ncbi:MATE family efflux transporter [Bacteroides ilei]|uniref:oligosaccharide flippase family protein n=1 Tax=Bacteroides ilei TaxID=1907658 RepID=UPI001EF88A53
MWLNLYTTRLVLANLGVDDMGVYGVVGSLTSMFTVFTNGITDSIQRFITFELGKKDGNTNNVFCTSINLLFIVSIALAILLETAGIWILNNKINIPEDSMDAAFWVYQFSIFACLVNIISIPYNALIIAHEKMNAFAAISIIQVILTCASAYSLSFFNDNKLFVYALLTAIVGVLIRIIYQIYCHYKFSEAKYKFLIDRQLIKDIGKYASISTISSVLHLIAYQGITFVINWTFGVTLNAVYNIAMQLKNSTLSFSLNLLKAISPQITKTYASGEIEVHKNLVYTGSKLETFLILFIMIPFLFKTEYIMNLWLGEVPEYTIAFVKAIIFISLIYSAFEPIRTAVLTTGRITKFMIIPNGFYLLVLPIGYAIGKLSENPTFMIVSITLMETITCILRIYFASKVTTLQIKEITKKIVFPAFMVAVFSCAICYLLCIICSNDLFGLCIILFTNSLSLIGIIYLIGLSNKERNTVNNIFSKILNKK